MTDYLRAPEHCLASDEELHSVICVEPNALHSVSRTPTIESNGSPSQHNDAWIGAILHSILATARSSFSVDYVSDVTMPLLLGACC